MLLFGEATNPSNGFYEAFGAERLLSNHGEFHGGYAGATWPCCLNGAGVSLFDGDFVRCRTILQSWPPNGLTRADYSCVAPNGAVLNRETILGIIKDLSYGITSGVHTEDAVVQLGSEVAIVVLRRR